MKTLAERTEAALRTTDSCEVTVKERCYLVVKTPTTGLGWMRVAYLSDGAGHLRRPGQIAGGSRRSVASVRRELALLRDDVIDRMSRMNDLDWPQEDPRLAAIPPLPPAVSR